MEVRVVFPLPIFPAMTICTVLTFNFAVAKLRKIERKTKKYFEYFRDEVTSLIIQQSYEKSRIIQKKIEIFWITKKCENGVSMRKYFCFHNMSTKKSLLE